MMFGNAEDGHYTQSQSHHNIPESIMCTNKTHIDGASLLVKHKYYFLQFSLFGLALTIA